MNLSVIFAPQIIDSYSIENSNPNNQIYRLPDFRFIAGKESAFNNFRSLFGIIPVYRHYHSSLPDCNFQVKTKYRFSAEHQSWIGPGTNSFDVPDDENWKNSVLRRSPRNSGNFFMV